MSHFRQLIFPPSKQNVLRTGDIQLILRLRIDDFSDFWSMLQGSTDREKEARRAWRVLSSSVVDPDPHGSGTFWVDQDGQGPRAESGSDIYGSAPAPAPGKKRLLQAAPALASDTIIFHFKLSKS